MYFYQVRRCLTSHWVLSGTSIMLRPGKSVQGAAKEICNQNTQFNVLRKLSNLPRPKKDLDSSDAERVLPRLMEFPEILWPSSLKTIKNWILVQFIIRPYFDQEFNLREFVIGAKRALQVISYKLMNGDVASLNNFVTPAAIGDLKTTIKKLSLAQRKQLEIRENDIYFSFPYQIGIIFDEQDGQSQKRWVEITMVYHVLRGLTEMRDAGQEIPWNIGTLPEFQEKVFICNYRFIKEFTSGKQTDWIVNLINHFRPIDLIK